MAPLDPSIGAPLTFQEVKRLVEQASPAIQLEVDVDTEGSKGRFLVAKKALRPGDIVLSEYPLFCGSPDATHSKKACTDEFVSLRDSAVHPGNNEVGDTDCLHPCSPLVDCLSSVLIAKHTALNAEDKGKRARAKLKIRQFEALTRASQNLTEDEQAQELLDAFQPGYRELADSEAIQDMIRVISNNRFSGSDNQLDLMFAGSMFEHSCVPNCFAGNWTAKSNSSTTRATSEPRVYRAMREIEAGEALSITYIQMPELYLHREGRAEILSGWGFACACPRCTLLPELTRSFVCPACRAPELCPPRPGLDVHELICQRCGHCAEASYMARCFELEARLRRVADGIEDTTALSVNSDDNELISCFHHAAFQVSWCQMQDGFDDLRGNLQSLAAAMDDLICCITHLHGDAKHPTLLELYHTMAELESGDIESQQRYLYLEREVLRHGYPEEAERQDQEIWDLVTGKGPRSNFKKPDVELSGMD
jgi:hypothetical protein